MCTQNRTNQPTSTGLIAMGFEIATSFKNRWYSTHAHTKLKERERERADCLILACLSESTVQASSGWGDTSRIRKENANKSSGEAIGTECLTVISQTSIMAFSLCIFSSSLIVGGSTYRFFYPSRVNFCIWYKIRV